MDPPPPSIFIAPDPPPFPASPRTVDLSALEFILALIAIITIPALIYTFFFSIKFPSRSRRSRSRSRSESSFEESSGGGGTENPAVFKEAVPGVEYPKDNVKDIGRECPICLSGFTDVKEVKQLKDCKHSFHASCINPWLNSHSNCPVCRASVPPVKRPVTSSSSRGNDLHQGLPDAADLV